MKHLFLYILLSSFILSSCGGPKQDSDSKLADLQSKLSSVQSELDAKGIVELEKQKKELEEQIKKLQPEELQDFYFTFASRTDLEKDISFSKTGLLTGDSSVIVPSNTTGQITSLTVKNGDSISRGQVIATLSDSITGYYPVLSDAKVALSNASASYNQVVASTSKTLTDAKNALEKAEADLASAKIEAEDQRVQNQNTKDTAQVDENIERLTLALKQSRLDYDNLLLTNQQTIANYENTYQIELQSLRIYLTNVVDALDELFGVSDRYDNEYDRYRQFLGARNVGIKNTTRQQVQALVNTYNDISSLNFEGTLMERISKLDTEYDSIIGILDNAEQTLIFSLNSEGSFSQATIDSLRIEIDGFQSVYQTRTNALANFLNQSTTFLATYKQNEELAKARLDAQKLDSQIQIKNLEANRQNVQATYSQGNESIDRSIRNAQNTYNQAKTSYDSAVVSTASQISSAKNAITSAQNRVNSANINAAKLTIRAPFSGEVSELSVDIGEQINTGTPVARITSKKASVTVQVSDQISGQIQPNDPVSVIYRDTQYTGSVVSVSTVANASLLYDVEIHIEGVSESFGDFAEVRFAIQPDIFVLPTSYVEILSEQSGRIATWQNDELVWLPVDLGKIWGSSIEILTDIDPNLLIITTDLQNFDQNTSALTPAIN